MEAVPAISADQQGSRASQAGTIRFPCQRRIAKDHPGRVVCREWSRRGWLSVFLLLLPILTYLFQEETLEVEYIESVMPPQKMSDIPHDDWVSSVSCQLKEYRHSILFSLCISWTLRQFHHYSLLRREHSDVRLFKDPTLAHSNSHRRDNLLVSYLWKWLDVHDCVFLSRSYRPDHSNHLTRQWGFVVNRIGNFASAHSTPFVDTIWWQVVVDVFLGRSHRFLGYFYPALRRDTGLNSQRSRKKAPACRWTT